MPRIYTSISDPIDFCKKCFPKNEARAFLVYGNLGDGPDNRENCFAYDAEHPDYENEDYTCEGCGKLLTEEDNHIS